MRKGKILEVVEVRPVTVADVLAAPPLPADETAEKSERPDRSQRTVRA